MPDVSQSGLSSDSHPQSPAKGDYKFNYYNSSYFGCQIWAQQRRFAMFNQDNGLCVQGTPHERRTLKGICGFDKNLTNLTH